MMKIKRVLLIVVAVFIISFLLFDLRVNIFASNNVEGKIYCSATLDEKFDDQSIILTLSNAESLLFKDYSTSDFSDINCVEVEELTENTTEIVKAQLVAEQSKNWSKLENRIENNMLIDTDSFHRILCLTLNIKSKQNVLDKIKLLENRSEIIVAEPDYIETLNLISNDPYNTVSSQWGLNYAYGINASQAWNITTGNNRVLVGVIDSGIDGKHPDLINNINEDLHRDYVDTPIFSKVREVSKENLKDPDGHGTHVAGIIGAQGNNNIGISGVVWNVSLVSLRVFNADGQGKHSYLSRAIDFATEKQIPILNYSGSGTQNNSNVRKSIENYPGLFVCAAGNDDQDNDVNDCYPANYNFDNLITVGAIKRNGKRPDVSDWGYYKGKPQGSNYGKTKVDIFAPGDSILSTYPTDLYDATKDIAEGYMLMSGTSMTTPFVTGVAALMLSANPNLTPQQLKFTIMNNATKYSSLDNLCVTGGRLDAFKSVSAATFSTSTVGDNIKINGFISQYYMTNITILEIPKSFAQLSSEYGMPIQEIHIIGNSAFKGMNKLKSIILPNSIISIDSNAFEGCSYLQSVTLSNNMIAIGSSAFKGCTSLARITIPNTVTNIDSSSFENCTSLENATLSNSLTSVGASVFKGCTSLKEITIPNSVTNIDSNAFENCTSLESVTLSNSLTSIGTSVFKGCTSLKGITIPNTVTNIDSNAFEGCTSLENIILPNRLHAIGTQAFKDCTRLSSIIFPSSVQYIDDEAFKNCSALSLVTVNREISDITNLGENVFEGTRANLQIIVPTNRIVEYKNKVYWSSYRNKIIPSDQYSELTLNCECNLSNIVNLNQSYNKLYKLNINCSKAYKFNVTSTIDVNIIVYDINMNVLSNSCNIATPFLSCGTYYISLEFVDPNGAGSFEMLTSLRWTSADIQLLSGVNEIKNSMHLNNENVYHCKYYYNNNQGAGFYKISLNTGSNIAYPEGTMKIYSDSSRTTILNRYGTTGINKQAITDSNENEIYLYLPEGRSYIDIVLPLTTYSSISLTIEQVESNNLNYLNTLSSTCLDEIFANKTLPIYFEEVIISHRSTIQLDIMTNGTITDNIPVYIMSKEKENGYDIGVEIYRLKLKLRDYITKSDRGPVFTTILDPGTYYIGYIGNNNNVSINLVVKRLVNQELNINGTLVADPANDLGFIAGSEVTLNGGSFRGNTITEGFTRHLYLMVENVLEEPMSRLEYDWYSSNENVAKVTAYGTVLALNVNADTDVTIYAVQKDEPSRVYRTTFTIKKETETDPILISCEMSYSYAQENGRYTLELDFSNSPYPMIQYYNWSIDVPNQENNISVSMNYFGVITSSGIGYVVLTGVYTINPRVTITITLTITE